MPAEGDQKVLDFAIPVWKNAKGVRDAIGMWDGVAEQAPAINQTNHGNFFALVQQLSLDAAVLRVSKIYDRASKRNPKYTAHDLIQYFESNISEADLWGYMDETIDGLCISKDLLLRTSSQRFDQAQRLEALNEIAIHLKATIPTIKTDEALEKIAILRDTRVAHQDRLSKQLNAPSRKIL